ILSPLCCFVSEILYRKYRQYRHTQMGQQVGAIIWGLVITGILKTLANILLPFFGIYQLLPLSAIFVLPGVFIYAYAILNFRLFSLQTALDQFRLFGITSKIALSIAAVAIMSFLIFQVPIAWWSFKDGQTFDAWRKYLVFSVISALVPNLLLLLLVVRTISRPLQRITLAAVKVTNGEYGTEADLRPSNDEIGLLADSFNEMSRKMASDIEKQRRLNVQLMRADKLAAMGTLAAGVAHEVNNPLASISSLVQMIKSEKEKDTEIDEKLDLISTQIDRITRVTKDLTDFARTHPAARSDVSINSILGKSLRLAEFDSAFQKLSITEHLDADLPQVFADGDQLQQVFLNLLLNARDAMPAGGEVTIRTRAQDREIMVEIADSGPGIDDETIKHVFDPFYTTKPTGKGTGLGLAVCYGIVTAHGGRIELLRNDPTGTRLVVTLPQVQQSV
ncbi:MAG: ATP-binding protein, partial [Acidobacteriota bacterium]